MKNLIYFSFLAIGPLNKDILCIFRGRISFCILFILYLSIFDIYYVSDHTFLFTVISTQYSEKSILNV